MIEIPAKLRCEKCNGETPSKLMIEGWEHFWCEVPTGWVEETRERRKGNAITEVRMHFCPACAREIEEFEKR